MLKQKKYKYLKKYNILKHDYLIEVDIEVQHCIRGVDYIFSTDTLSGHVVLIMSSGYLRGHW